TWDATIEAELNHLQLSDISLDRVVANVTAHNGVATIQTAEATKASNKIAINGTANLPEQLRSLGQSPAAFQITGSFPDLQSLTAQFPEPLSGAANLNGQLEIKDAVLHLGARINSE